MAWKNTTMNDFTPSEFFTRITRFWWLLICLMIAGGLIGLAMSMLFSPVYESKAVITSTLDYAVLGKVDDWEEDQQYLAIGDVINSSTVKEQVLEMAKQNGLMITLSDINNYFSTDRQDTRWVMRVRSNDPNIAYQLNQLWVSSAISELKKRKEAGIISLTYQNELNSLSSCFDQAVITESSSPSCNIQNLSTIREKMSQIAASPDLLDFRSSLLLTHTSFEITTNPTLQVEPVLHKKNFIVLSGTFIGFFLGLILFTSGWPSFNEKKDYDKKNSKNR